jgi:hypothetical protein
MHWLFCGLDNPWGDTVKTLSTRLIFLLLAVFTAVLSARGQDGMGVRLSWTNAGIVALTPDFSAVLDYVPQFSGPVARFGKDGAPQVLVVTNMEAPSPTCLRVSYAPKAPNGAQIHIVQDVDLVDKGSGWLLTDVFQISAEAPIGDDLEIRRFYTLPAGMAARAVAPLKNGWAREIAPMAEVLNLEYRLGNAMTGSDGTELALPVLAFPGAGASDAVIVMDPRYSSLFRYRVISGVPELSVHYRYASGTILLENPEQRTTCLWVPKKGFNGNLFETGVDQFFLNALPDVPPGPKWLHDIALVDYDYLSENGNGWEKDVAELAKLLAPEERKRAVLCFHGWYDAIGTYCYDASAKRMLDNWTAMARTRKVPMTKDDVRRKLRLAREQGFRVLMYFGDGLLQDSGTPGYRPEWDYTAPDGKKITGWEGPDTWDKTYARNPANPDVAQWYEDYLGALIEAYGADVDGFVWDETFYIKTGMTTLKPAPAYCDRAMMRLVKTLAQKVHAFDPEKVFLSSDDIGVSGLGDVPGYAMVAHGTYQDSWCHPVAWSFGLFPNWRNVLWSCNWKPFSGFGNSKWGVENFGTPVAISHGWGEDRGVAEWKPQERDRILGLFRERLAMKDRVRYLTKDPAELLAKGPEALQPGDPIPEPAQGEQNWALASGGAKVSASSQYAYEDYDFGPAGVIDGIRDDSQWGRGGGWASKQNEPLPQWVEIEFPEPRYVSHFVVITYQSETLPEKADKWGVRDYDIQVWNKTTKSWDTVVEEDQGRAMKTRVHALDTPVMVKNFRVLVRRGATLDNIARLLEVEAWGKVPEKK